MRGHSERAATYMPGREASPGNNPTGTLRLSFQPPEPEENTFLFKPPSRGILLWQPELTAQLLSRMESSSAGCVPVHPSHPPVDTQTVASLPGSLLLGRLFLIPGLCRPRGPSPP